jgi:predicted RNase H-like HicB family nuclease
MALDYPVHIVKLSPQDGGGYLATVPLLPGCMSDGETPEEALRNIQDAITAWIDAAKEWGQPVPEPVSAGAFNEESRGFRFGS